MIRSLLTCSWLLVAWAGPASGAQPEPAATQPNVAKVSTDARPQEQPSAGGATKRMPRVIHRPRLPAYPAKARSGRREAKVAVRLLVNAEGRVAQAELLEPAAEDDAPGVSLDEVALRYVLGIRFEPAVDSEDRPIATWITWIVFFRLE